MPLNENDLIPVGLSGNVIIYKNAAEFTKTILPDQAFEGTEKFIVRLRKGSITGNIVASTAAICVYDTSTADPLPSYSLAANKVSVNEGEVLVIVLTTRNVAAATSIPYRITGVTSEDIGGAALTGNFIVTGAGTASLSLNITADQRTEGAETLTVRLDNILPVVSISVVVNDTSITAPSSPAYNLSTNVSSINEGQSATFTLVTTNVARGTLIPYTLSGTGVTTADIGAPLSGNLVVGASGTATLTVTAAADVTTEGDETITLTLANITPTVSQTITVKDTSLSTGAPTYALSANKTSVNEGESVTVTLVTTGLSNGLTVPYTITGTGITVSDLGVSSLTGNFTVNNSTDSVTFNIANDITNEGPETFTLTLDYIVPTVSAVVSIVDTSRAPLPPSYALGVNKTTINEGESVTFTLTTVNVSGGTRVPFTITGPTGNVTPGDFNLTSLSGNFVVTASGTAQTTITLNAIADQLTEGTESITLTLNGVTPTVSSSVTILDTSRAPVPSYQLSYSIPGYNTTYINNTQKVSINTSFRQYLGRNASPEEITYWFGELSAGRLTLLQISNAIRNTPEAIGWDGKISAIENSDLVVVKLTTSNVPTGTLIPYTITGVNSSDLNNAPLTGSFSVGANGEATLNISTSPDRLTESSETANITLNNITPTVSTTFSIKDTSISPTYTLSSSTTSANEGTVVTITLSATNAADGTVVPFTISGTGINTADLAASGLVWNASANRFDGSFTVQNSTASIGVNVFADKTTEGAETFNITLTAVTPTVTRAITINDTSSVQTGSGTLSVPGLVSAIATLPDEETWVAFRMIGAGGSGGGPDSGGTSGLGISGAGATVGWSTNLNESGIKSPGNPFSFTLPVTVPNTGSHTFVFTADDSGTFSVDGGQVYSWSQANADFTVSISLSAGVHNIFISCTNTTGSTGVGLKIFGPDSRLVFNTWQAAFPAGGSGGPGNYIEGIVKLPITSGQKILRGGVGAPGPGGASMTNVGSEPGGRGFGMANLVNGVYSYTGGDGGRGGAPGRGGQSGQGGAGGGATNLFYQVGTSVVTIAVAGGGAGGAGKGGDINGAQHGQLDTGLNLVAGIDGQDCSFSDGPGGGGGGGNGGRGGRSGQDRGQIPSGGDSGTNYKNTALTWNTWNEYNVRVPSVSLPGSIFNNLSIPQAYNFVPLGRGGKGVLVAGTWANEAATNGTQGAISIYWTTSPTAPDLSSVPGFGDASDNLNVIMPATQDAAAGVVFFADGTCVINNTPGTWIQGASIPGAGDWYEIKFSKSAPTSGSTTGTMISNIPEDTWYPMYGNGTKGYFANGANADGLFDVTVSIRRRTNGATVGTVVYKNVGTL